MNELNQNNETAVTTIPPTDQPPLTQAEFDAIESLVRLLVGSSIELPIELAARLKQWEEWAAQQPRTAVTAPETSSDLLRYALVGLVFQTHDQVRSGASQVGRLASASAHLFLRATRPITSSRPMQPVRSRYDELAARGETAVNQWIERGRTEEPTSRAIARQSLNQTIDEVIEHLAENQEVRELVQNQGASIAGEVVGGVRARTVTADYLLERFTRSLLKRPPRELLPPPSAEVMAQATEFQSIE